MFNLDPGKLLVIAVVAIILLGPDKLPQVARQVGAAWRSFNEFRHRMESEVRSSMPDLPPTSEIARLARSPSALLTHLSTMTEKSDAESEADGADGADGAVAESDTVVANAGEVVTGNGAHAPAGDNGSAPETAPAMPLAPVTPAPAPRVQAPETTVPVDPSLN